MHRHSRVLAVGTIGTVLVIAGCQKKAVVVERTPEALARARTVDLPRHDGTISAPPLRSAAPSATGVGRIAELDRDRGSVTLDHDAANPADWPAMRLEFNVRPPRLLNGLMAGERVKFHLEYRDGVAEIVALERYRPSDAPPTRAKE